MPPFLIHKYSPLRDKEQIERLLVHNNDLLKIFCQDEWINKDNILVALIKDTLIGFLSFNGFGRKPQATLFLQRILWLEIMRRMITLNGTEFAN